MKYNEEELSNVNYFFNILVSKEYTRLEEECNIINR